MEPPSLDMTPGISAFISFFQAAIAAHAEWLRVLVTRQKPHITRDRLREMATNSQQWLARYQAQLSSESGIPSLKVGFNKVFGYYIEVTNVHKDKVSPAWTRKQTTTNAERYITAELKNFETEACRTRLAGIRNPLIMKNSSTPCPPMLMVP